MSTASRIGLVLLIVILLVVPYLVNPYVLQIVILTITYSMLGLAFALSLKVGLPRFELLSTTYFSPERAYQRSLKPVVWLDCQSVARV